MSSISTHVLDTALGKPAAGIVICLSVLRDGVWTDFRSGITDADGRCPNLTDDAPPGTYQITFATEAYFAAQRRKTLYPQISITFVCAGEPHYHLPVLLSDNSYTTYRGS